MTTTNQTAILPDRFVGNGKWHDNKETVAALVLVAWASGKQRELVTVRFWMSRSADGASPVYCTAWIHGNGNHGNEGCAGTGRANGYGYHKQSAALQSALDSAGVKLAKRIDGVGETAMKDALLAIGRAMGYTDDAMIVVGV